MGSREELCITIVPETDSADTIAQEIADELEKAAGNEKYTITDNDGADGLGVFEEAGRVYIYGLTFNESECRFWKDVVLGLEIGDGQAVVAHTQEAWFVGHGWLYDWSATDEKWILLDEIRDEGGYDDAIQEYFLEKYDIFARTFSYQRLDDLPDRVSEGHTEVTSYFPP